MRTRFFQFLTVILAIIFVVAANLVSTSVPPAHAAPAQQTTYTQVWSDEFNGAVNTLPSSTYWNFEIGDGCPGNCGWGNNEKEYYTNSANNVSMDGAGNLRIIARAEGGRSCYYGTCRYSSARIQTAGKVEQKYGKIEARIKLAAGQGLWPAFWMLGNNIGTVGWPQSGEIDMMENHGSNMNSTSSAVHGPGYFGATPFFHAVNLSSSATNYHTYGVEWDPTELRFFVDGVQHYSVTSAMTSQYGAWVFDHPFFIIFNQAVGGNFDGDPASDAIFPATMLIDYVRVYNKTTATGDGTPYSGTAVSLPGTVQIENFNNGGEGVAYHDAEAANQGGQYRTADGVDIEATTDTNAGYNVGWTAAGEWTKYTVNVGTAGTYNLNFRVASAQAGGSFHLEVDNTNVTGALTVPNTGGWQTWTTVTKTGVSLSAGQHIFKLVQDAAGGNFNWFSVSSAATAVPTNTPVPPTNTPVPSGNGSPYGGTARAVPGTIQAEDFNTGGQAVAYNDTDTANSGGQYRTTEGVDIEATTDTGAGYNVGWTAGAEWMKYTVNVGTAGTYSIDFRVASTIATSSLHLEVDGTNVTGTMTVPNTGGWQTWTTITKTGVSLSAGQHVLRLVIDVAGMNLNWIKINSTSTAPTPTKTPTCACIPTNTSVPPATATKTNTPSSSAPAWQPGVSYAVGNLVTYNNIVYRCLQAHTSQVGWEPPNVPALWAVN